jgi:AbrB family looped-hinge helix DNA binding protein
MVATLTSEGQITIPVAIRQKLDIRKGDRVSFVGLPTMSSPMAMPQPEPSQP